MTHNCKFIARSVDDNTFGKVRVLVQCEHCGNIRVWDEDMAEDYMGWEEPASVK